MDFRKLLYTSLVFLAACSSQSHGDGILETVKKNDSGIVGGSNVDAGSEAASLVVLVRGQRVDGNIISYKLCTGAFVADNIVLTAAHCFKDQDLTYDIVISTSLPKPGLPETQLDIDSVVIHENYIKGVKNDDGIQDDIALVKTKTNKPADVQNLRLPENLSSQSSFKIQALGFGRTTGVRDVSGEGQGAGVLRHTEVTAVDLSPEKSYILLDQSNGQGICNGDSGGPGILKMNGQYIIVGVANSVLKIDDNVNAKSEADPNFNACGYNGLYMNVEYYRPWIEKHMAELRQQPGLSSDVAVARK